MIKNILGLVQNAVTQGLKYAVQSSGTAALYLGTSTLLAAILLTAYLSFAWDIDKEKWLKAYGILRGEDISEMQEAARIKVDELGYYKIVDGRIERLRSNEFDEEVRQQIPTWTIPPKPVAPPPPPPPSDDERIGEYERRVQAALAAAEAQGLADEVQYIQSMEANLAKDVIIQHWKGGKNQRVLDLFKGMDDEKKKSRIINAFRRTDEEELKILDEIMQKIGDGDPLASIIKNAAKED